MVQLKVFIPSLPLAFIFFQPAESTIASRDATPRFPIAPDTTTECNHCNVQWDLSYCVDGPPSPESAIIKRATRTVKPRSTSTYNNGIFTPAAIANGIVYNCNKFILAKLDDTCSTLAARHSVPVNNIASWNSLNSKSCNGLQSGLYYCVSVQNGLKPPNPVPGVVSNCTKFHKVALGDSCTVIGYKFQIDSNQVAAMNSLTSAACSSLVPDSYVCISTSTAIEKPSPLQPNITPSCDKFHQITETDTCWTLAERFLITVVEISIWNQLSDRGCTGLQIGAYACVSVVGHPDC
ncbi:LysM domain-containing protein [Paramyrothecium foliicola]|nr:LysM domain-containing protein [Paramyrothecium foliicola]